MQVQNSNVQIDERLTQMNNWLYKANDWEVCVPNRKRMHDIKREISDDTRKIYEARSTKFNKINAQGGKVWNRHIMKKSNLKDYNTWLKKMVTEMEEADKKGDSETIFRCVKIKIISGLMKAAAGKAPSVGKDGDLILDQNRLAQVWQQFLQGKFEVTEEKVERDPYEDLRPQLIADPITEEAFVRALKKDQEGQGLRPRRRAKRSVRQLGSCIKAESCTPFSN